MELYLHMTLYNIAAVSFVVNSGIADVDMHSQVTSGHAPANEESE